MCSLDFLHDLTAAWHAESSIGRYLHSTHTIDQLLRLADELDVRIPLPEIDLLRRDNEASVAMRVEEYLGLAQSHALIERAPLGSAETLSQLLPARPGGPDRSQLPQGWGAAGLLDPRRPQADLQSDRVRRPRGSMAPHLQRRRH